MKNELQNIIQGKSGTSQRTLIQTVDSYLRASQKSSTMAKNSKHYKQEEANKLVEYCNQNNLWANDKVDFDLFFIESE